MTDYQHINYLKQLIIDAGMQLLEKGLVSRTFGNISIRLNDEQMLITPSGRKYDDLRLSDIVAVNIHSGGFTGKIHPSSEYKLHAAIYTNRPEINAIIHTHQQNASTISVARKTLPSILDDQAQLIGEDVRVAEYADSSSDKLVENVVRAIENRMAAMMANHGAICIGRDIEEAFVVSQVLEKAAKAFIEASFIGGAKAIDRNNAIKLHREYQGNYSAEARKNR
ncbi:MAG: class II aldolase/adducin family protein [Chlorobi bacterium]|nr:class II aldolase/adducin family protein [Chlorobiota bacterium]